MFFKKLDDKSSATWSISTSEIEISYVLLHKFNEIAKKLTLDNPAGKDLLI